MGPHPFPPHMGLEATQVCIAPTTLVSMLLQQGVPNHLWHHVSPFTNPFVPSEVSIILVGMTFSLGLDKPCLSWQKIVCAYKYFLFNAIYKEFSYLYSTKLLNKTFLIKMFCGMCHLHELWTLPHAAILSVLHSVNTAFLEEIHKENTWLN